MKKTVSTQKYGLFCPKPKYTRRNSRLIVCCNKKSCSIIPLYGSSDVNLLSLCLPVFTNQNTNTEPPTRESRCIIYYNHLYFIVKHKQGRLSSMFVWKDRTKAFASIVQSHAEHLEAAFRDQYHFEQ